jgi:hypothetical protein
MLGEDAAAIVNPGRIDPRGRRAHVEAAEEALDSGCLSEEAFHRRYDGLVHSDGYLETSPVGSRGWRKQLLLRMIPCCFDPTVAGCNELVMISREAVECSSRGFVLSCALFLTSSVPSVRDETS